MTFLGQILIEMLNSIVVKYQNVFIVLFAMKTFFVFDIEMLFPNTINIWPKNSFVISYRPADNSIQRRRGQFCDGTQERRKNATRRITSRGEEHRNEQRT